MIAIIDLIMISPLSERNALFEAAETLLYALRNEVNDFSLK